MCHWTGEISHQKLHARWQMWKAGEGRVNDADCARETWPMFSVKDHTPPRRERDGYELWHIADYWYRMLRPVACCVW